MSSVKVLHLIPSLGFGSAEKQLCLLAERLPGIESMVCSFQGGALRQRLERTGIRLEVLGHGRIFDPAAYVRLRRVIRAFVPDVLHAWRPLPMASRWFLAGSRSGRVILGLTSFPVLVEPQPGSGSAKAWLPDGPVPSRWILCAGRLERRGGFKDAIWAMDILKYLHADLYLGIAGDGPERGRLERFARDIGVIDRVRFLGWRKDLPALLTTAEVFWSPGDGEDIPLALLEAMAAGLPVVASRGMATSAVLSDPTAGLLFPCGDKPALAEQTQVLLKDAMLRKSLGESARRIILEDYDLDRARSQFGAKYYSCVSR